MNSTTLTLETLVPDFIPDNLDTSKSGSRIIVGNALEALRKFGPDTFRVCVTSPPYWGLRDYGVENQLGAEADVASYVENICTIFEAVRRVLKPDGTMWLNLG